MENIKWEKDENGVLHMYVDVAQLKLEDDWWIANSKVLCLENNFIEFEEQYTEEEAIAYIEGYYMSETDKEIYWKGDF